jgi:hypothetical protein
VWTEPVRRFALSTLVDDDVLDLGALMVEVLERMQRDYHHALEREHRVLTGVLHHEQYHDPPRGRTRLVLWADTVHDPAWLHRILDDARRAVEEDQAWLAAAGEGRDW